MKKRRATLTLWLGLLSLYLACGGATLQEKVRQTITAELSNQQLGVPAKFLDEYINGATDIMMETFTEAELKGFIEDPKKWDGNMMAAEKHAEYTRKLTALSQRILMGISEQQAAAEQGTPQELISAIREGEYDKARQLIEAGANLTAVDKVGLTALDLAVSAGHMELAQLLIAKGANVNAVNVKNGGYAPLHNAVFLGQTEAAELLISHGAEVNALTNKGKTPMALAAEKGHDDCVALLEKHGGHK